MTHIRPKSPPTSLPAPRLRRATVTAVLVGPPPAVTIQLGGDPTPVNAIYLDSCIPKVNDVVSVIQNGPDLLVIGPVAPLASKGTYSPFVTATTTPALGASGFLTGRWWRVGQFVTAIVDLHIAGTGASFGGTTWRISLPFWADLGFHQPGILDEASDAIGNFFSRSGTVAESRSGIVLLSETHTTGDGSGMIFYYAGSNTSVGAVDFTTTARLKAQVSYVAASPFNSVVP